MFYMHFVFKTVGRVSLPIPKHVFCQAQKEMGLLNGSIFGQPILTGEK